MNKFQKLISDNSDATLNRRSNAITTQAKIAQETIVNALTNRLTDLEIKIDNLTDLAPDNKESLRPGGENWNAADWATELQRTKWEYWNIERQLQLAKETLEEFFTEE